MELYTKVVMEQLLNADCPAFFKERLIKDITSLEGELQNIKILYGVDIEVKLKPIEKPQGRWLGKGIVEQIHSYANTVNNK